MTRFFASLAILLYSVAFASAATLYWNGPTSGMVTIERKDASGTFQPVEQVTTNPPRYELPTGAFGDYRLSFPGGTSNTVTYAAGLSTKVIDADHVEIDGLGCQSLKTTGTGLKRIVECVK